MKSVYSAYTEVVYKDQEDGSCHWHGRLYNRVGPATVLETQDGIASSRAHAMVDSKAWSENILDSKYRDAPDLQVITTDDIGILNVEDLGLE